MPEPKIDVREGICGDRSPTFGESPPAVCVLSHGHSSSWHQDDADTPQRWTYGWDAPRDQVLDELSCLRTENAGLREALEAARPVVEAAVASIAAIRELTGGNLSSTWISQQTQVLAAAVDSYTQSHDGPETALRATLEPAQGQPRVPNEGSDE